MKDTIEILQVDQVKLIKHINIISQNRHGIDIKIGYLLYERNYNVNYKMAGKKENESQFDYLLTYPRQEDFPEDDSDKLLLEVIRTEFPKSFVYNKTLFTTSDIEILKNIMSRPSEKAQLIIHPDFSEKTYDEIKGKSFGQFGIFVTLYTNGPIEYLKNIIFSGTCDYDNHVEIIESLNDIKFL